MKKFATLICVLALCIASHAQNYLHMNIVDIEMGHTFNYCINDYDGIVIEKEPGCNNPNTCWDVQLYGSGQPSTVYYTDEITILPEQTDYLYFITYRYGCEIYSRLFGIRFHEFQVQEPWSQDFIWKRTGTSVTLEAPYGEDLQYQWSNGSHQRAITVTQHGTYWVRIYNDCGEIYDTIQVRNNVEISLATCDLESNLNMVTWPTTDAQAEYISEVKIYRDGTQVGTASYTDGFFIDNIGSDAASRTYTVKAVGVEGTNCPITSNPKETIHMTYTLGMGNTIVIGWNQPTGYNITGYNICEWQPDAKDGDLTVIDYVGAGVTSYTCQESQFDHGMIVVQGVKSGKSESRLLSNRSQDYVGLGEKEKQNFNIYPNPSAGRVTIEGTGRLTITNVLGQTVITRDITDTETIELPRGVWFVKMNDATRKVVVE